MTDREKRKEERGKLSPIRAARQAALQVARFEHKDDAELKRLDGVAEVATVQVANAHKSLATKKQAFREAQAAAEDYLDPFLPVAVGKAAMANAGCKEYGG